MIVIHAILFLAVDSIDRVSLFLKFGFIPTLWTGQGDYGFDSYALISPITYIFLHGNWMHIAMNGAMLMAFGAGVEQWMGARKYLLFFILCGIAAVVVEVIINPFGVNPVIGASGALSGLFAAILVLLQSQGRLGAGKYGIWPFAAVWIGISVIFGLVGGALMGGVKIAWAAHLGGFIAGFCLLKMPYFNGNST